jgi:F-type H+-transporting ATPase subunit b
MATEATHTTQETHAETQAEPTGVLGALGIDGQLFIAQLLNFAIVLFVMWRWVYRPLLKKMDERSKKISDGLTFSEESKRALADATMERDRIVNEAKAQAHLLVEDATKKAEGMRAEKMAQAKTEIEKVISEAKAQIKSERDSSFAALKGDIAELVSLTTAKVASKIDDKTHRGLISDALTEIEKA